ncbi:MAG: type II toxin-antitoxin system HicB family antitoxin [Candidatus Altiarchaeota archaeon]
MNSHKYKVVLQPAEEGGYTVIVLGLPGCFTQGNTKEEALRNAREAIECHLDSLRQDGVKPDKLPKAYIDVVSLS